MIDITLDFEMMYVFVFLGSAWLSTITFIFISKTYLSVLIITTIITGVFMFGGLEGFSGLSANDSKISQAQNIKQITKRQNQVNYQLNCKNTPEGFYDYSGEINICISKKFN